MEHGISPKPTTQSEARRAEFNRRARAAKDLADLSLQEIDEALVERQLAFEGFDAAVALRECDVTIDGLRNVIVYDPNQGSLWD